VATMATAVHKTSDSVSSGKLSLCGAQSWLNSTCGDLRLNDSVATTAVRKSSDSVSCVKLSLCGARL